LAPESLVTTNRVQYATPVASSDQVMRYVPVTETQVVPAPLLSVPAGPTITRAPHTVLRPVIPLASPQPTYYFGQGLLGQPKLYVPGQPIRNALRHLSF
jgi:hypothetical protein